jgi:hypothetical protein
MPDPMRLVRIPAPLQLVVKRAAIPACDCQWGDSRNMMRGSLLGMGFGMGLWAGIFGLLALFKI